jgi:hypothetical protein
MVTALLLDHPTCADCIIEKSTSSRDEARRSAIRVAVRLLGT